MRRLFILSLLAAGCGEVPTIVVEPLSVRSWEPNQGAQCVAAGAAEFLARVTFSDDLDSGSLNEESLFVRPENGTAVDATISYDKASQTARLTASQDLIYGAVYELVVTDEVSGASRGNLPATLVSSFTTVSSGGCF